MAVGYTPDGDEAPLINLGYISPAGQMYSTINDLNKVREKNIFNSVLYIKHTVAVSILL